MRRDLCNNLAELGVLSKRLGQGWPHRRRHKPAAQLRQFVTLEKSHASLFQLLSKMHWADVQQVYCERYASQQPPLERVSFDPRLTVSETEFFRLSTISSCYVLPDRTGYIFTYLSFQRTQLNAESRPIY